MKITCLAENTASRKECLAEHGLSVYIQTKTQKILLDFGQRGETLLHNAQVLGVDLSDIDLAVLSHGHYDHAGGLQAFLEANPTARVFLHKNAFGDHYNGTEKYIGMSPLLQGHPQLRFVEEDTQIGEGVTIRMPKQTVISPLRHGGLTKKLDNGFVPDDFSHELYLEVEEQGKRVLFSGCAHKGIENIMAWFAPTVFVGGMHLSHFSLEEVERVAKTLQGYQAEYLTGHCTGVEQTEWLKQALGTVTYMSCGSKFTL